MLPTPTAPSPSSPLPDIQRLAWRCRPIARAILCRRNVRADAARSLLPARLKAAREANSPDTPRHPPCPVGHAPEPGWPAVSRRSGIRGAAHMRRLIGFHPRLASASIATDAALSPVQNTPFKALISHCFSGLFQGDALMGAESDQGRFDAAMRTAATKLWIAVDKYGDEEPAPIMKKGAARRARSLSCDRTQPISGLSETGTLRRRAGRLVRVPAAQ